MNHLNNRTFIISPNPYSGILIKTLRQLGLNVLDPLDIENISIILGTTCSRKNACWPARVTLGTILANIDKGFTDIILYKTKNCYLQMWKNLYESAIQKYYNQTITIHCIRQHHICEDLQKLTNKSMSTIVSNLLELLNDLFYYEKRIKNLYIRKCNILMIGEPYTVLEPRINYNIREHLLLKNIGSIVPYSVAVLLYNNLMKENISGLEIFKKDVNTQILANDTRQYYDQYLKMQNNLIQGVIHIIPVGCTVELPHINYIATKTADNQLPFLQIFLNSHTRYEKVLSDLNTLIDSIKKSKNYKKND